MYIPVIYENFTSHTTLLIVVLMRMEYGLIRLLNSVTDLVRACAHTQLMMHTHINKHQQISSQLCLLIDWHKVNINELFVKSFF